MSFDLPEEYITKYVERRYADLEECLRSLEQNDFSKIQLLAHQMKGNGTSFGFPQITELGGSLEIAAKDNDPSLVKTYLEELQVILDNHPRGT